MSKSNMTADQIVEMDRRRRERRDNQSAQPEKIASEGGSPRRKQQRRRQIDPTTCERDYNDEEILFMQALDAYKRSSGRMCPTCSEILEVIRGLGYIKLTSEEREILDSIQAVEEELAAEIDEAGEQEDVQQVQNA